jgi:hypothetical protein
VRTGVCSTRPSPRSGTHGETGVDALRLLFEVGRQPERPFELNGWHGGPARDGGCIYLERKGGDDGQLWRPERLRELGAEAWQLVEDHFTVSAELGVSRVDLTTTRKFDTPAHGRAFMAGIAAIELPRMEAIRRGTPPHSVGWAGAKGRKLYGRAYDKSREQGGEPWEAIRLEDQRSMPRPQGRVGLDVASDPEWQRERFVQRFGPMRKAVTGVTAASFPVIAQALADEVKYGYRDAAEARQLAGSMVLFGGGADEGIARSTRYRWRAELREAGYVVVDDFMEPVAVDLGEELDAALEEFGA